MDGLWLESKQALSEESVTFHQARENKANHDLVQVPWNAWFPHIPAADDEELFEFSARIDNKGTMLSLLWVPSRS